MLSVKGIYDGENIRLVEKIKDKKRYKVIITFVEEIRGDEEPEALREFASQQMPWHFGMIRRKIFIRIIWVNENGRYHPHSFSVCRTYPC